MTFISDDKTIENKVDFVSQYQKITRLLNITEGFEDLEIYKRLQIPEVWMWDKSNNLSIYILNNTE